MKRAKSSKGFTLLDVLVVVATVVILGGVWLVSRPRRNPHHHEARCGNNLKQISIGFRLYSNDGDPYPPYSPTNQAWQYFQPVGSEIGSPRVLQCPNDEARQRSDVRNFDIPPNDTSFANSNLQNSVLSYFYGADCDDTNPNSVLAGDRSISTNETLLTNLTLLNTAGNLQWNTSIHKSGGYLALGDGSVQLFTSKKLLNQMTFRSNVVQRFVLP